MLHGVPPSYWSFRARNRIVDINRYKRQESNRRSKQSWVNAPLYRQGERAKFAVGFANVRRLRPGTDNFCGVILSKKVAPRVKIKGLGSAVGGEPDRKLRHNSRRRPVIAILR